MTTVMEFAHISEQETGAKRKGISVAVLIFFLKVT
jgi:Na+/melibiose symporter-like transporter